MRLLTLTFLLLFSSLIQPNHRHHRKVQDADTGKPLLTPMSAFPKGIGTTAATAPLRQSPQAYTQSKLSVSFIGYATYERPRTAWKTPSPSGSKPH